MRRGDDVHIERNIERAVTCGHWRPDDSVAIRADAYGRRPGPSPAPTDFSGHAEAFDADAGAAGHMVKTFGDGSIAADGDGF
jgi:hypothetical protein